MNKHHFLLLVFFLFLPAAYGGIYFQESFTPQIGSSNAGTVTTTGLEDVSTSALDFRSILGLKILGDIYLGGTFNYIQSSIKTSSTEVVGTSTEYGPAIGFSQGGVHMGFAYLFGGTFNTRTKTITSGTVVTDQTVNDGSGSGYQATLGYAFSLGTGIGLGASVVYRSMSYKNTTTTDNLTSTSGSQVDFVGSKYKQAGLVPMLTLLITY